MLITAHSHCLDDIVRRKGPTQDVRNIETEKGHNAMCQMLVAKQCNLDTQNENGWTAFIDSIAACYKGNVALAISFID